MNSPSRLPPGDLDDSPSAKLAPTLAPDNPADMETSRSTERRPTTTTEALEDLASRATGAGPSSSFSSSGVKRAPDVPVEVAADES